MVFPLVFVELALPFPSCKSVNGGRLGEGMNGLVEESESVKVERRKTRQEGEKFCSNQGDLFLQPCLKKFESRTQYLSQHNGGPDRRSVTEERKLKNNTNNYMIRD